MYKQSNECPDLDKIFCDECKKCIGLVEHLSDNFGRLDCVVLELPDRQEHLHFCDTDCFIPWVLKDKERIAKLSK